MPGNVRLIDALSDEKAYGHLTEKFINYTPDKQKLTFYDKFTGCEIDQTITTERLSWNPFVIFGYPMLIGSPTNFSLTLCGKTGYKNASACIKMAGQVYESKKMHAQSYKFDVPAYEKLSEKIRICNVDCWMACDFKFIGYGYVKKEYYGQYVATANDYVPMLLYKTEIGDMKKSFAIRPVVKLPKETLICLGDPERDGETPDKAHRIFLDEE